MAQDKTERDARLKLALRDNLRKRKAQERDQREDGADSTDQQGKN